MRLSLLRLAHLRKKHDTVLTCYVHLLPYFPPLSLLSVFPTIRVHENQCLGWPSPCHSLFFCFRNTERFLARIWNSRFATTVANVAPPPRHDLGDVNPLLRELAQDLMLQVSKSPTAKSQAEVLYIWKVLSILQNAVTWACSPQD